MYRLILCISVILSLSTISLSQSPNWTPYEIAQDRIADARESGAWTLDLSSLDLTELPPELWELVKLRELDLRENHLTNLPPEIGRLVNLRELNLDYIIWRWGASQGSLPEETTNTIRTPQKDTSTRFARTVSPEVTQNTIQILPPEIGQLRNLEVLSAWGIGLTQLPPEIGQLTHLRTLDLRGNQLTSLPPEIGQLENLHTLYLHVNQLTSLPPEIGQLENLHTLYLHVNQLTSLPPEIGQLTNLKFLLLNSNNLTVIPLEIGQLHDLCVLQLEYNQLQDLPHELGELRNLYMHDSCAFYMGNYQWCCFFAGNPFTNLPEEIRYLGSHEILDYLRNQAAWHLRRTISGVAVMVGGAALFGLGIRWRTRRYRKRKRKTSSAITQT